MERQLAASFFLALLVGCGGSSDSGLSRVHANKSFWIPFTANATAADGTTGIFVIPSDNPAAAPKFVTNMASTAAGGAPIQTIGEAFYRNISNSTVTDATPGVVMYLASDASGNQHLYGLDLSDTSKPPAPRQISNLSITASGGAAAATMYLCAWQFAQSDLTDPTTLFTTITSSTQPCGSVNGQEYDNYLVRYEDSTTSQPVKLTSTGYHDFHFTYTSAGQIGGALALESTGDVNFYERDTFSNPRRLMSGLAYLNIYYEGAPAVGDRLPGFDFLGASLLTGSENLYRVTADGTVAFVYTAVLNVENAISDENNLYFQDNLGIWQASLQGGTPQKLTDYTEFSLLASNGSTLLLDDEMGAGDPGNQLATIPIGVFTSDPALLAGIQFKGSLHVFTEIPKGGTPADTLVFANATSLEISGVNATEKVTFATEIFKFDGTVKQALQSDSYFVQLHHPGADTVIQVQGTAASEVDPGTLAMAPITTSAGTAFNVPDDTSGGLVPLSNTLSAGLRLNYLGFPQAGEILDASHNMGYLITVPDTAIVSTL